MTTAQEAYEFGLVLLKATRSKSFHEYIGEWNTLMLYLGEQVAKEKSANG